MTATQMQHSHNKPVWWSIVWYHIHIKNVLTINACSGFYYVLYVRHFDKGSLNSYKVHMFMCENNWTSIAHKKQMYRLKPDASEYQQNNNIYIYTLEKKACVH